MGDIRDDIPASEHWIYRLVSELQIHEDTHAAPPDGVCHGDWLELVPTEIQRKAAAWRFDPKRHKT